MDLEAGVQIGDFVIERRIGAGGMGVVYLARQVSLDRLVALKVIGSALQRDEDLARFQREAQAVARLNHPHIAAVHYIGQDQQVCYMSMSFIAGVSLRRVLDRLARLDTYQPTIDGLLQQITLEGEDARVLRFDQPTATFIPRPECSDGERADPDPPTSEAVRLITSTDYIRRCCEIARDAALALAHAHERGVIHRDIKPQNLLLDKQWDIHIIDFGIARFFEDATLTETGALIGTPMYMSPEQVTARFAIDHRTDIYSLGLVLYELLTIRRPIAAPTREGVLRHVVTKPLLPVSRLNRAVPRELESVIHKATAKDPDDRYATAAEFAEDLERFLSGEPVSAPPYRYRFVLDELAAERPTSILTAALTFFILAITCFIAIPLIHFNELVPAPLLMPVFLGLLAMCVLSLWIGGGLLRGRGAARILALGVCSTLASLSWFGLLYLVFVGVGKLRYQPYWSNFYELWMAVALGAAGLLFSAVSLMLTRYQVRKWFELCRRLRSAHEERPMAGGTKLS